MTLDDGSGSKSLLFRIWKSTMNKKNTSADDASSGETESIDKIFALDKKVEENPAEEEVAEDEVAEDVDTPDEEVLVVPGGAGSPDGMMVSTVGNHPRSDIMKVKINYLEAMRRGMGRKEIPENLEAFFSDFTLDEGEPNRLEKIFLREVQQTAKIVMEMGEPPEQSGGEQPEAEEPEKLVVNAQVCVKVPLDNMSAWIFVFPPLNGGKDITEELVMEALNVSGVKFGIEQALIKQIVGQRLYMKLAVVAVGKQAIDGVDGTIVDHFPRIERNKFAEMEDADERNVDYKDLNWLHQIAIGDIICDITMPLEGENGMMVTGELIKARKPENFTLPSGENVLLNNEKTTLYSKIDGTLFYENGKFHIKDVLNIMSDVDLTVGNINTIGNVVISGDVLSGFSVKATGNINIRGMVGNSTIIAGGNIKIGMGVRGNGEALLESGETINCVYMENCTARARGIIESGSIINCNVISDDSVISKNIVGGSITALNKITANTIGNQQRRQAVFNLGITQQTLKEKTFLTDQIEVLENALSQGKKNIRFLMSKKRKDSKDEIRKVELTAEAEAQEKLFDEYTRRLEEIQAVIDGFSDCELTANIIYPPVTVMIRSDALVIDREESMCRIRTDNGEITMY